jgi:hypothetical protein
MTQWYYQDSDGTRIGPLNDEDFQERFSSGTICEQTPVWRSGFTDWTSYGAFRTCHESRQDSRQSVLPLQKVAVSDSIQTENSSAVLFAECTGCGEQWPAYLLIVVEKRHLCGRCLAAQEKKGPPRAAGKNPENGWVRKTAAFCIVVLIILLAARLSMTSTINDGRKAMSEISESEHQKSAAPGGSQQK